MPRSSVKLLQRLSDVRSTFRSRTAGSRASGDEAPHPFDIGLVEGHLIRLIELSPGAANEPLSMVVRIYDLDDAPSYDALSYAWNPATSQANISWHIRRATRQRRIPDSLFAALDRVRLRTESRMLWADAICIDQENPAEKGHQVAFMDRVYAQATRVLVFLGEDRDGGARDVVALLEEHVERMGSTPLIQIPVLDTDSVVFDDPRWKSLAALLTKPWFDRAWGKCVGDVRVPRTQCMLTTQ